MNWNDVKYGRTDNSAAITTLENSFKSHIENCVLNHTHNGGGYQDVIKTIKARWVGPDADAFVANFENRMRALVDNAKKVYTQRLVNSVTQERADYAQRQAKNAQTMKF